MSCMLHIQCINNSSVITLLQWYQPGLNSVLVSTRGWGEDKRMKWTTDCAAVEMRLTWTGRRCGRSSLPQPVAQHATSPASLACGQGTHSNKRWTFLPISFVQDSSCGLGNAHMCSTPSLRTFLNVALQNNSNVWLTGNSPFSSFKEDCRALPLPHLSLPGDQWFDVLGYEHTGSVSVYEWLR